MSAQNRKKDRWHRSNNNMIATKTNKQTSKKNKQQKWTMHQTNVYMYSSHLKQWTKFDEVWWCVRQKKKKKLKKVTCLPKMLFSIDIIDIWVLPCFCILFKRRLKSVTKAFMSNVVLGDLKVSEPINYSCIVNIWWNVTVQSGIQTIKKRNLSFLL